MSSTPPSDSAERVRDILAKGDKPYVGLRVGVKNGGCAGMSYTMDYAEAKNPLDEVVEALQREPPHLRDAAGAVGGAGGVAQVDEVLVGELLDERAQHSEAAEARVEHPDGSVKLVGHNAPL